MRGSPEHRAVWMLVCLAILAGALALAELVYLGVMAWG